MLSYIIAFKLTNMKAMGNEWDRHELIIDYTDKLEGCDQSNTANYSETELGSFTVFRIKPGKSQCLIGNVLIGSDSDIVGISGFPDENSNFVYSDLIQNPLVSMGKSAIQYSMSNQPFPITRIQCKDKTKACTIRVAYFITSSYGKFNDPDEGDIEYSIKVVIDTKSKGDYTLKSFALKPAGSNISKRLSTYGLFISKFDRTFRYLKMDGMKIDEEPSDFLEKYTNKPMSSLAWYSILASVDGDEDPETIYKFRFRYDEIPDTETLAPFLFRDDLSLTIPTKYGLYTIENASQPNPFDPDPTPTPVSYTHLTLPTN